MAIEKQVVPSWKSHSLIMSMVNGIPLTKLVGGEGSFSHALINTKLHVLSIFGKIFIFRLLILLYKRWTRLSEIAWNGKSAVSAWLNAMLLISIAIYSIRYIIIILNSIRYPPSVFGIRSKKIVKRGRLFLISWCDFSAGNFSIINFRTIIIELQCYLLTLKLVFS